MIITLRGMSCSEGRPSKPSPDPVEDGFPSAAFRLSMKTESLPEEETTARDASSRANGPNLIAAIASIVCSVWSKLLSSSYNRTSPFARTTSRHVAPLYIEAHGIREGCRDGG